jgi:hypothetical protein
MLKSERELNTGGNGLGKSLKVDIEWNISGSLKELLFLITIENRQQGK